MSEFRPLSQEIEEKLSREQRKSEGIFFTPKCIRERLVSKADLFGGIRVLEPSAGSCEFVQDILSLEPTAHITAIEKNPEICSLAKMIFKPIIQGDFLSFGETEKFDLIVGNPPYLQVKGVKDAWRAEYGSALGGKFDLYILFLLKALRLLRPGGVLKFILPTAFLSTFSYNEVRRLLAEQFTIADVFTVREDGGWKNTKQNVVGLTIRNSLPKTTAFCAVIEPFYFINERHVIERLAVLTAGTTPLSKTGVGIKTGEVVWGPKYAKTPAPADPILIRNSFLTQSGHLVIPENPRQQLRVAAPARDIIREPVILVNRGNGNNGKLNARFAYFDPSNYPAERYVAENHIYKIHGDASLLKKIYTALLRQDVLEFIQLSNGSGFLTKRYLEILPVRLNE